MNLLLTLAVASAVLPQDSAMWRLSEPAYENPAVKQWMFRGSHSAIGAGYRSDKANRPTDLQLGRGERSWHIGGETYLKYKTSTLWGDASYTNGTQLSRNWNETSDLSIIYPYVTADSIGGDMKMERYRFAGGYADHSADWAWGAALSYDAGLYYRNVDPRPRNVTGLLNVSAGGARRVFGDYFAGIGLAYRKYKQSCDIEFKNEMGVEKIYHLTSLGTQYQRFAGVGDSYYYDGNRLGLSVNFYPASGRGLMLTANLSRFTFDKVLKDLNKLPLNHARHNAMEFNAAYVADPWGVAADFSVYRRHGYENIFGDASSGIYPQIASLDTYADNAWQLKLSGVWQRGFSQSLFWIKPAVSYGHRSEVYISPRRQIFVNKVVPSVEVMYSFPFAGAWRMSLNAGADYSKPVESRLRLDDAAAQQPQGLIAMVRYRFAYESRDNLTLRGRLTLQRSLNARFGLALSVNYAHTNFGLSTHRNIIASSISLIF